MLVLRHVNLTYTRTVSLYCQIEFALTGLNHQVAHVLVRDAIRTTNRSLICVFIT